MRDDLYCEAGFRIPRAGGLAAGAQQRLGAAGVGFTAGRLGFVELCTLLEDLCQSFLAEILLELLGLQGDRRLLAPIGDGVHAGLGGRDRSDRIRAMWVTAIGVFVSVAVVGVTWARFGAAAGVVAFLLAAVAMVTFLRTSNEIGWRLPPEIETVGDVVRLIAPIEVAHGSPGERLLAQQQVLTEVRRITSQQLGLALEKIQPESDFVKDLGVG